MICQQGTIDYAEQKIASIEGVTRVDFSFDGPFQRLTIQVSPGNETALISAIQSSLGEQSVESIVMRDPTLEEAYLNIIN